jgi:signal transduction histidine kinase
LGLFCFLAVALVVWIKSHIWERLGHLEHSFATIQSESFFLGMHVREAVLRLNSTLLRYQLSGELVEKDNYRAAANALTQRLGSSRERLSTSSEQKIADQLEVAYEQYLEATAGLRERAVRGVRKESVSQIQEQIDEHSRVVLELADQLVATQRSAMGSFFAATHDALNSLQRLLWFAVVLLLSLIGSVAALSYRTIVAPLRLQLSQSQSLVARHEKLASLGALAAGVAHEIRNPLTAIKFRLFSFKKALPVALHDNEDLATIGREVNRLERIVKDFLQFARPSDPILAEIPVGELLEQTQRLLRDELKARGVDLVVSECPLMTIQADRQQIQQVLINLIQNGAESISRNGTVTLAGRQGAAKLLGKMQPAVMIDVADTGRGIPQEAETRLFDPFFSTKENGTGLGLSIAARIVEKHGGFIQYATRPNRGATFSLVLPVNSHHEIQDSVDRR